MISPVHTLKTQGKREGEIKLHSFLSSEPDGDESSAIRLGWITPQEKILFTRHLNDV